MRSILLTICVLLVGSVAVAFQIPSKGAKCWRHTPSRLTSWLDDEEGETINESSRRSLFYKLTTIPLLSWASPATSFAAPPMTLGESDGLGARTERALRPKPPKILRPKLNQDFAVLLMRSSYNALDKIDCIAMVRFFP